MEINGISMKIDEGWLGRMVADGQASNSSVVVQRPLQLAAHETPAGVEHVLVGIASQW